MFSIDIFKKTYDVERHPIMIRDRQFSYFLPRAIEPFIDVDAPINNFPLWAKVWPASMVLADFMASQPVDPQRQILEIGAGIGIAGIAASAFGHHVSISEYNKDALEFTKANAVINGFDNVPVFSMDWNHPRFKVRYDQIIGSEVIFREQDFSPILNLFKSALKLDGEVILVSEIRKPVLDFYQKIKDAFDLKLQQKILRSENEEIKIIFCRMTPLFNS